LSEVGIFVDAEELLLVLILAKELQEKMQMQI